MEDANLIAACIIASKSGDSVQAFTTSGETVINFELTKKANRIESKRAVKNAIDYLRQYFSPLFNHPPTQNQKCDVAAAVKTAIDRFNYSKGYEKLVLVLLSDGIQKDDNIDWTECVPSDSWCIHQDSPFSRVNENTTGLTVDVLIIPRIDAYVDSYHANQIERWYQLFFHIRKARLLAVTFDHFAAKELLIGGKSIKPPQPPHPVDLNGPLVLTLVAKTTTSQSESGR